MNYIPRPLHAILAAMCCVVCLLLSQKVQPQNKMAWYVGAFFCGSVSVLIIVMLIFETMNERVRVMTEFAIAISGLSDEKMAVMAFEFPYMRWKMKSGIVREYYEDTHVPVDLFRLFLQTSSDKYISPERDWNNSEKPRWAWLEIKQSLEDREFIIPDSAAGSHSWMWNGKEAYHNACAYWMAGRKIADMNVEMES